MIPKCGNLSKKNMESKLRTLPRSGAGHAGAALPQLKIGRSAPDAELPDTVEKIAKCKIGRKSTRYIMLC